MMKPHFEGKIDTANPIIMYSARSLFYHGSHINQRHRQVSKSVYTRLITWMYMTVVVS